MRRAKVVDEAKSAANKQVASSENQAGRALLQPFTADHTQAFADPQHLAAKIEVALLD